MEEKRKILFVINPRSGVGRKKAIEKEIRSQAGSSGVEFDIVHTTHRGHARSIAENYRGVADVVVAVGGDGTVNEVGTGLIGSRTALGIVPCGSGNGLARELDIPLRVSQAIDVVAECNTRKIDVMLIDGQVSLNVAGVGFDAYISHLFAKKKVRGPLQYMNLIAKEFPDYSPCEYVFDMDGGIFQRRAFLISFANSSQWGNNIHIAPEARLDDGLIDVCVVSEFPNVALPSILFQLLNDSISQNKYDEIIRTSSLRLLNPEPLPGHVDGEPVVFGPQTEVEIMPLALNVVCPSEEFYLTTRFSPSNIRNQIISSIREPIRDIKQKIREIPSPFDI